MADTDHETAVFRVKAQVEHELLQRPGVHGVGIGHKKVDGQTTGTLAVVVSVEKKRAAGELDAGEMIPDEVDGVKFDVVEAGPFEHAFRDAGPEEFARAASIRPLQGGAMIGVPIPGGLFRAGTLGGFDRMEQPVGGFRFFEGVSCEHVVGQMRFNPDMTPVSQPPGGQVIGKVNLSAFNVAVDAAGFALQDQREGEGWVNNIIDIGMVAGARPLGAGDLGSTLKKYGATTGLTTGVLAQVAGSFIVDGRDVTDQLLIEGAFADSGDSGSFVMSDVNGQAFVSGLLMAKAGGTGATSGIANRIGIVIPDVHVNIPPANVD